MHNEDMNNKSILTESSRHKMYELSHFSCKKQRKAKKRRADEKKSMLSHL